MNNFEELKQWADQVNKLTYLTGTVEKIREILIENVDPEKYKDLTIMIGGLTFKLVGSDLQRKYLKEFLENLLVHYSRDIAHLNMQLEVSTVKL